LLTQLVHNGVLIPKPPAYHGLEIMVRGEWVKLTPQQEEMALAWAKKQGTSYVEDPVFCANFMADFSAALGIAPPLSVDEADFSPAEAVVEAERAARERLTPEERKALAAERKAQREALRAVYGYAIVDGQRVEVANYIVEPSGIFMGRGEHPLRGRWKAGAQQRDVTLNLSPDAPIPPGEWAEIVWQPESLWLARWVDKLSGRLKYVWPADTAPHKQEREARKFDAAAALAAAMEQVRAHIQRALCAEDAKRREIATACYLIDALCLRVGDEKDEDEADTVGATTLRPEHVTIHADGTAEFRFLGKDSVPWHKTIALPEQVRANLAELMANARPSGGARSGSGNGQTARDRLQLFPRIGSHDVNAFLAEVMPELSAKVFRTHHATEAVEKALEAAAVSPDDPEYVKWQAANMANLEAAILCNHTKKESATWPSRRARLQERIGKADKTLARRRQELKEARETLNALRREMRETLGAMEEGAAKERKAAAYAKKVARAEANVQAARRREGQARDALGKLKAQLAVASKSRSWNLGTSLKSYIDPRVYYRWGQQVDYDVLDRYYPTTLRRKFGWVENNGDEGGEE